jgi:hypothetical protein
MDLHPSFFLVSFKDLDDLGHLIVAPQPDRSSFVNGFRNLFQYSPFAIKGETASFLDEFGHGETFVEKTKFSTGGFLVGGVSEDSAVQERTMDISYHGADVSGTTLVHFVFVISCFFKGRGGKIPRTIGFAGLGEFDGVEVFGGCFVPIHCISLVDRVNTPLFGDAHLLLVPLCGRRMYIRVSQDEFAESIVEGKSIDTIAGSKNQIGTCSIHTYNQTSSHGDKYNIPHRPSRFQL